MNLFEFKPVLRFEEEIFAIFRSSWRHMLRAEEIEALSDVQGACDRVIP